MVWAISMAQEARFDFYSDIIERQAAAAGDKPYILHEDRVISFAEFERFTCRAANGLAKCGGLPGSGVAVFMGNCPEYLYLFNGLPRAGFYTVPVNTALKGDGLRFILTDSDVKYLVADDTLYPSFKELGDRAGAIEKVFVRRTTDDPLPPGTHDLEELLDASPEKPSHVQDPDAITSLIYTSGTTGFPKGVVYRNRTGTFRGIAALSMLLVKPEDVLYTCLPLFHINALMLTAGQAMARGAPFGLEKRFSASGFWNSIRRYGATQFNALGAMVPILMKQPARPDDADNPVRLVVTSACPANLWEPFCERFKLTIWELYGAVDGGGVAIVNFGNAPVGSVGKPPGMIEWKLIDDSGNAVPQGQVGELVTRVWDKKSGGVEYYKNPEASRKKVRGDWLHSGDYFYADKEGFLYFVDRKSDCMRRRGENISSFEVENIIAKHPAVSACAAFGVPSELGEDEVMIWVQPRPGAELDLANLIRFCSANMAYFMVPRFIDVVDNIPRTETWRVQKGDMKKRGVTERTWDREREMPDFKLKK